MTKLDFCDSSFRNIDCVITVGVFDGLHLGHMKLIRECVRTASELNARSVVITFSVNPKMYCGVQDRMPDIDTPQHINDILENTGVDYHCVIDFSDDISKLSGEEFIAKLCTSYRLRAMVVGEDFRCGNPKGQAGPKEIGVFLSEYTSDAVLRVVSPLILDGEVVSSSLIRRCLLTGDLEKASRLLGRPLNSQVLSQNGC